MMIMMVMVTIMVNICDDDCCLVMKVILVNEVLSCDVSPVAMFFIEFQVPVIRTNCVLLESWVSTMVRKQVWVKGIHDL